MAIKNQILRNFWMKDEQSCDTMRYTFCDLSISYCSLLCKRDFKVIKDRIYMWTLHWAYVQAISKEFSTRKHNTVEKTRTTYFCLSGTKRITIYINDYKYINWGQYTCMKFCKARVFLCDNWWNLLSLRDIKNKGTTALTP